MEVNSWNLHHGSYLMERTPLRLFSGCTALKVPNRTYTMEGTSWNLQHGSYLVEYTPLKLLSGTYTMEGTS